MTAKFSRHAVDRLKQRAPEARGVDPLVEGVRLSSGMARRFGVLFKATPGEVARARKVSRKCRAQPSKTKPKVRGGKSRYYATASAVWVIGSQDVVVTVIRWSDESLAELLVWLLFGCWTTE